MRGSIAKIGAVLKGDMKGVSGLVSPVKKGMGSGEIPPTGFGDLGHGEVHNKNFIFHSAILKSSYFNSGRYFIFA